MMDHKALKKILCDILCSSITVNPVPDGLAVSLFFTDRSGDRLGCYIVKDGCDWRIKDDGDYLAYLVGLGLPLLKKDRKSGRMLKKDEKSGRMLESILSETGSFWDPQSCEIQTQALREDDIGPKLPDFVSSLLRVRDLEYFLSEPRSNESTFKEEATDAITERYEKTADISHNQGVDDSLSGYPADLVIRPKTEIQAKTGACYLVHDNNRLNEALLLHLAVGARKRDDVKVIALLEAKDKVGKRHYERANREFLPTLVYETDKEKAIRSIGDALELAHAA